MVSRSGDESRWEARATQKSSMRCITSHHEHLNNKKKSDKK